MMTNSLRKLIKGQLKEITKLKNVYYAEADTDALYPHAVFLISSINTLDLNRKDYDLTIDLWDKSKSSYEIEDIADCVENKLQAMNIPFNEILPTFYTESRKTIIDDDKTIKHLQLSFLVQVYERDEVI